MMEPDNDIPSPRAIAIFAFVVAFLLSMAACGLANAAEPGKNLWQATKCAVYAEVAHSCTMLRAEVRLRGLAAVKATARKCGASEAQINERESACGSHN